MAASSMRETSWRAIRKVSATMPLAEPEWTPSSSISTVRMALARPRSDVVTQSRS